jgi:hypothetical protein
VLVNVVFRTAVSMMGVRRIDKIDFLYLMYVPLWTAV